MRRSRSAALLSAAALLVTPVVASAATTPSLPSLPFTPGASSDGLRTSWPAVPVGERLSPWLAEQLERPGDAPLRVMVSGTTIDAATDAAEGAGLVVQQTWRSSGIVVAVGLPAQVRDVVDEPGVRSVEGDEPLAPQLDTVHKATRSDVAEAYTIGGKAIGGAGVTVAVIDSGIDGTHPFFTRDGRTSVVRNLKNVCTVLSGPTEACFQQDLTNDTDTSALGGHGTHVAGITGGVRTTLADGSQLRGSAPDVSLVGLSLGAGLSIINANAAMQWVLDHHRRPCMPANQQDGGPDADCPPIKVTNHSYGPASVPKDGHTFDEQSATVTIQRALVDAGVTVVWAAGNSAGDGSVATTNPPAMDPKPGVLMVASYNDADTGSRDNELSTFSSRGKKDDATTWPDLSAPGSGITSACRPYLAVCSTGFDFRNGPGATDIGTFNTISGTSMAAPYVAGVVAQLVQAVPGITPEQIELALENNAHQFGSGYEEDPRNPSTLSSFDKGHGLVDVAATLATLLGQPAPGEPAPSCTSSSFQMTDPAADADEVVLVATPLPTQDSLDVVRGHLSYDGTSTLTVHLQVTDLEAGPPDGSVGEFFRFYLARSGAESADPEVFVTANRRASTQTFLLRQQGGKTVALEGVFDVAADEVRVTVPFAAYGDVLEGRALAVGDKLAVNQVLGQRDTGAFTLTADTASGSCPFVIGTSTPGVEPAGSTTAECPPPGNSSGKGNAGGKADGKAGGKAGGNGSGERRCNDAAA